MRLVKPLVAFGVGFGAGYVHYRRQLDALRVGAARHPAHTFQDGPPPVDSDRWLRIIKSR